jgi:hypothetical protein
MAVEISDKQKKTLENEQLVRILVSNGKAGKVHGSRIHKLQVTDNGTILYFEYIESSLTNQNLIYSLWFDKEIEIFAEDENKTSFTVRGIPKKAIIEGAFFEEEYKKVQKLYEGQIDLSTIWEIEVLSVENANLVELSKQEQETYPMIQHLDRIAKEG